MRQAETIQLYTLEDAEKIIDMKRRKAHRQKVKQLRYKLLIKSLGLILAVCGALAVCLFPQDGSASAACILLGLFVLFVPVNVEFTW